MCVREIVMGAGEHNQVKRGEKRRGRCVCVK